MIILGSGASAAYGIPGIPQLRDRFLSAPPPCGADPEDAAAWATLLEALKTTDLESALNEVQLWSGLTRHIAETTWDCRDERRERVFGEPAGVGGDGEDGLLRTAAVGVLCICSFWIFVRWVHIT